MLTLNRKSPPSPIRADPSRTATLRRRFEQSIRGRMRKFKGAVNQLLVEEDVFGLKPINAPNAFNVANTRWRFRTSDEKKRLFEQWMATQIDKTVLNPEDAYWEAYIQQAYMKGQGRAFDDFMKGSTAASDNMDFIAGSRQQFLTSAFRHPPSVERVKLLASRVFTDLRDVTDTMATQMSRTLVDGLIQGTHPTRLASIMSGQVDGLTRRRANVIARTEIIRAHADGQLDGFERMGLDKVGVMVEWAVTPDSRLCPLCAEMGGVTLSLKEARNLIPRHPSCRCAFMPAQVGESPVGQKKGRKARKAIDRSIQQEIPASAKRTIPQQKELSKWSGADLTVGKVPKAIVGERKLTKIIRLGKKAARLSNLGPELASEVAKQAGVSDRIAKMALVVATAGDFAVPGIPVGSAAVILAASVKDPRALIRTVKALVARSRGTTITKTATTATKAAKKVAKKKAAKKAVKKTPKKKVVKKKTPTKKTPATKKATVKKPLTRDEEESSLKDYVSKNSRVESFKPSQVANAETFEVVEIEGIIYRYPPERRDQVIRDIVYSRQMVGPNLQKVNRGITYSTQKNMNDEYWASTFNQPNFKARATAGGSELEITVYNSDELLPSTLAHESGHNLAQKTWGTTTPPPGSNYAKAQALEKPVSDYGALAPYEDFAEAVRMYSDRRVLSKVGSKHDQLKKDFPNKFKAIQELLGDG